MLTDDQRIESNASVRIAGRSLEERIAELEAAVGETANDDEFEPDGSEDQALHRPDRIVYTRPPLDEEAAALRNTLRLSQIALLDTGPADDSNDATDSEADASDTNPVQFRHGTSPSKPLTHEHSQEAPMAEDVKETLTAAEVHVFNSPDEEIERIAARLNGEPIPEPAPFQSQDDVMKPPTADDMAGNSADSVDVDEASEDVLSISDDAEDAFEADLERAVESANEPVVQASETAIVLGETLKAVADATSEDATQLDDADNKTGLQTQEPQAQEPETALAEEAISAAVLDVLDEDDLRPIVARMIREELQGELGERITRNVRKLVRREILRALAARDIE